MGYPNFITLGCSFLSPSFWKACLIVIFSFILFFDGSPTRAKVFHIYSRCSLECYVNMISILCKSSCEHLVISSSYHTYISFVFDSLPYIVTYPLWFVTSYYYTSFTLSMWTYHWWSRYPLDLVPVWEWMQCSSWYSLRNRRNYCFGKWNTCIEKGFKPFSPPHSTRSWYFDL